MHRVCIGIFLVIFLSFIKNPSKDSEKDLLHINIRNKYPNKIVASSQYEKYTLTGLKIGCKVKTHWTSS